MFELFTVAKAHIATCRAARVARLVGICAFKSLRRESHARILLLTNRATLWRTVCFALRTDALLTRALILPFVSIRQNNIADFAAALVHNQMMQLFVMFIDQHTPVVHLRLQCENFHLQVSDE